MVYRFRLHGLHLTRAREVAILRGWLGQRPGELLLDVGCGNGFWTARLAGVAQRAVGLDISEPAIDWAQSFYADQHLSFMIESADALPYPDATVDRAVCVCALQNFPDPVHALHELGRVIIPGGLLAVSVDSLLAPDWVSDEYRQYHAARFATGRQYDLAILSADLKEAGFELLEHRWLLRSRAAAAWAMAQERLGWSINWWFPLSWPASRLADRLAGPAGPGLIVLALAKRRDR